MSDTFYLNKKRGQPGQWYGYVHIGDVTYKIDARHVGKGRDKHFVGTTKRHLKADQMSLLRVAQTSTPYSESVAPAGVGRAHVQSEVAGSTPATEHLEFNDELPETL